MELPRMVGSSQPSICSTRLSFSFEVFDNLDSDKSDKGSSNWSAHRIGPETISTSKEKLNRVEQIDGCLEPTIRGSSMPVTVTDRSTKFRQYTRPNGVFRANKKGGAAGGGMSHLLLGWPLHDK
ncbi:hypothetical protein CDAR_609361 [Caerostris darwini]|uniref:Uncharacterized protein n=1 Tax=Caerostris darwini TaxID=1538125 RepID=A0AAV4UNT7_9ARAC|nr:hypothetical protein CDAR_609361 [Caerostris darwini]